MERVCKRGLRAVARNLVTNIPAARRLIIAVGVINTADIIAPIKRACVYSADIELAEK